jgi:hypothetical protein
MSIPSSGTLQAILDCLSHEYKEGTNSRNEAYEGPNVDGTQETQNPLDTACIPPMTGGRKTDEGYDEDQFESDYEVTEYTAEYDG